jgi:putative SOS response-associated peptidase YedK
LHFASIDRSCNTNSCLVAERSQWKDPVSGEWTRSFAIITTDANDLVAEIHDRMPLIIAPGDHRYREHPALTELRQCTDDLSESLQRQAASRNDLDQSVECANGR